MSPGLFIMPKRLLGVFLFSNNRYVYFYAKTAFWAGFWENLPINKLFVLSCSCVPAYSSSENLSINKPGAISLPFLLGRFLGGGAYK